MLESEPERVRNEIVQELTYRERLLADATLGLTWSNMPDGTGLEEFKATANLAVRQAQASAEEHSLAWWDELNVRFWQVSSADTDVQLVKGLTALAAVAQAWAEAKLKALGDPIGSVEVIDPHDPNAPRVRELIPRGENGEHVLGSLRPYPRTGGEIRQFNDERNADG